ncbi:MAG: FAD-binding oxidoreductase [Acidimicrobiia bacterium]|jgi:FAD/FMN-containing dehydrogenase
MSVPGFTGIEILPGDPAYDEARAVFNGMIDRRPAVILRCTSADDVVAVVNHARAAGLPLSVYGGGHAVTGSAVVDGGIVCDMRGMKGITVDPDARIAVAEAGLTWGEFDAATQEHGLAVTGGRVPTTGIAGLALGSGSGWLERRCGFTCDNLVRAEVVTADGRRVVASADENPELFWGLRGGGGNFGIVTAFHLRLHAVGPLVLGGLLAWPGFMAADIVPAWRDFMADAPDELGTALAFITAPPADFVPEEARGHPVLGMVVCWSGDLAEGEQAIAPMRALGPVVDVVAPMPYVALQQIISEANPHGMRNYWSADFLADLPGDAIATLVAHATNPVSPLTQILLAPGGGAIARVPDDADAFGERHAKFNVHYLSMWADPADDETNIAYTRGLAAAMKPWTTGAVYLNYIGDEGYDRVKAGFGAEKYARLQAIKDAWDPENLFRQNQNIPPTSWAP